MEQLRSLTSRSIFPTWLTGPIFDKELRVASRRKRYYASRSIYLGVMAILVLTVWVSQNATLRWQSSSYNVSRMAEIGRTVILSVVWFQFIASQIAAILFFSSAICDEMNRGTLNVLMTTPITTLQIVMGKLLSKLLQLVLLISLSLLTLSIVYILGGVHWDYILSTFFITLTAVIFTGSLTLFCSGRVKRAHSVIIIMLTFICVYYMIGPMLISILSKTSTGGVWLLMLNPIAAMLEMTSPRLTGAVAAGKEFAWPMHCVLMLGVSAVLVMATTIGLRKSILTFAFETSTKKKGLLAKVRNFLFSTGCKYPIVLKSLPSTRWYHRRREVMLFCFLIAGYLACYWALYLEQAGSTMPGAVGIGNVIFSTWSMTVWLIVVVRTIVCASTAITKEKESRSLSVLLCCPLTNSQIIKGKARHILRSNYIGWVVLMINSAAVMIFYKLFVYKGMTMPGGIFLYSLFSVLMTIGDLIFIIGFGLYLSTKLRSSTAALIAGLAGYMAWYFVRYIVMIIPGLGGMFFSLYSLSFYIRPFIDIAAGLFFYWRAKRLLRKNCES